MQLVEHVQVVPLAYLPFVQRTGVYALQLTPLEDSYPALHAHVLVRIPVDVQAELAPQPPLLI